MSNDHTHPQTPDTITDAAEKRETQDPVEESMPDETEPDTVDSEAMNQEEVDSKAVETVSDEADEGVADLSDRDDQDTHSDAQTALSLLQVEDYINQQMKDLAKLRDQMREIKSSVDDTFQNDAQYREFEDKAKEAAKNKNAYKKQMMNDPAVSELVTKLDGMKADVKDMQGALSDYLREYNRISGMTQFETADGEMLEIVNTFKLVKKKE